MGRKKSYLRVKDQFCGAGGNSQAVRNVAKKLGGGIEVEWALNHWQLAIDTHTANFPETKHDCTDISACDPRRYDSTDILITSPECTTHTPAGGNHHRAFKKQIELFSSGKIDPATERSRATMWDVVRFAEYHQYNLIFVENVVEAKTRWPLFDNWLKAMHTLGYSHKVVYLNSMHFHPTPQSRDRMYIVFWKKGNPSPMLDYTPKAWCPKCEKDVESVQTWKNTTKKFGKYRQQYVYCCPACAAVVEPYYYASMNIIEWSNLGSRIGDRPRPLKPKTIERIRYGQNKYAFHPIVINDQHSTGLDFRVRNIFDRLPTIPTTHQLKLVTPFIIKLEHGLKANSILESNHTQTGRQSDMLIQNIRSSIEALQTQTTTQSMGLVVPPFLTELHNNGETREVTSPLNTITAGGYKNGLVTHDSWNAFISTYNNASVYRHYTEEMPTISTIDRNAVISYENTDDINDCYYRMLTPYEVKLGMAFDKEYVIKGSSKDKVKQCGNAVTPPVMEWLLEQGIQTLS